MNTSVTNDKQFTDPRQLIQGLGTGMFLMGFFAGYWAFSGGSYLSGAPQTTVFGIAALLTIGCFVAGIYVMRSARLFEPATGPAADARGRRIGRWFSAVFGLEIVLIVLAAVLLGRTGNSQYIVPVIALIVGLHFLPLAWLYRMSVYYITGAALSLLGLVGIVCLLLGITLGGPDLYNWSRVGALAAAVILWLTLAYILALALRLIVQRRARL